jgi:hypothetical protein
MAKGKVLRVRNLKMAELVQDGFSDLGLDLAPGEGPAYVTALPATNTAFHNFARNMLITSSEVMTPVSLLCLFTTGRV